MIPVLILLGLVGAGFGAYEYFSKPRVQVLSGMSPIGMPVHVIVPVPPAPVAYSNMPKPAPPPPVNWAAQNAAANAAATAAYVAQQRALIAALPPPPPPPAPAPKPVGLVPKLLTVAGSVGLGPVLQNKDVKSALQTIGVAQGVAKTAASLVGGIAGAIGNLTGNTDVSDQVQDVTGSVSSDLSSLFGADIELDADLSRNIAAFERVAGLPVTGQPTPQVKQALAIAVRRLAQSALPAGPAGKFAPAVAPNGSLAPTLKMGAQGKTVSQLQHELNAAGANPKLTVDGLYGPVVSAAVTAFQIHHGLTPNGEADAVTQSALTHVAVPAFQKSRKG